MNSIFWENTKKILKQKNITSKKMCEDLDYSYNTYRNKVSKNLNPDSEEIVKIANYLGVTTDYLLKGEPDAMEKFMRNPKHDIPMSEMESAFKTVLKMFENAGVK